MSIKIVLFDPSINYDNYLPKNLGDQIISNKIQEILNQIFNGYDIVKVPIHDYPNSRDINLIKEAKFKFVGGTNLLGSNIEKGNQWRLFKNKYAVFFNKFSNVILFGVGWGAYQNKPSLYTKSYYKSLLTSKYFHSLRDNYTKEKLAEAGVANGLNTSCPTTWQLKKFNGDIVKPARNSLLMLTDWLTNPEEDNLLINFMLNYYEKIYFFSQGEYDLEYLKSLNNYKNNKTKFTILDRTIQSLDNLIIGEKSLNYIGNRLHGGIHCFSKGVKGVVIAIDNRASEIGKDIYLPVLKREEKDKLRNWIEGNIVFGDIKLPLKEINNWIGQFKEA